MNVVLPELDGRIIGGAISFKGEDERPEGAGVHAPCARAGAFARRARRRTRAAWARLRRPRGEAQRRIACVLSDYPGKGGRAGYAVGLDTPAERRRDRARPCAKAGYRLGGSRTRRGSWRGCVTGVNPLVVRPRLGPAVHVFDTRRKTWMAGPSPPDDGGCHLACRRPTSATSNSSPATFADAVDPPLGDARRTIRARGRRVPLPRRPVRIRSSSPCSPTGARRKPQRRYHDVELCRPATPISRSISGCARSSASTP